MKYGFLLLLLTIMSCDGERTEDLQQIDQVFRLYMDSAGVDMLNTKVAGSYTAFTANDLYGARDVAPISTFALKKDSDTAYYLEYIFGARRVLRDSAKDYKTYESAVALKYLKQVKNKTLPSATDTLILKYSSTPQRFQLQEALYKSGKKTYTFRKTILSENILKVKK